jgi:hypothetical protein
LNLVLETHASPASSTCCSPSRVSIHSW